MGTFGGDYDALESAVSSPEKTWEFAPVIYHNESLKRAAHFLKNSQDHFHIYPGEIDEVRRNSAQMANNAFGQSQMETALQESFKTVEALLGDPPKDDRKFFARIGSIGLDPNELVGYSLKRPLHQVIRLMNKGETRKQPTEVRVSETSLILK